MRCYPLVLAASVLVCLASVGCGPKLASVKGKVTVNGEPLKIGNVMFMAEDGTNIDTPIKDDGSYDVQNVPVGQAKVLVSSMDPKFEAKMSELVGRGPAVPEGNKAAPAARGKAMVNAGGAPVDYQAMYNNIDPKFNNFASSGLSVTVTAPSTTYDIATTKSKK